MSQTEVLESALLAAKMGFPTFPVNPRNKQPLIKDWPNAATLDLNQVKKYWRQFPNAMIGAVIPKHWAVIDIDINDGECAFQKLKAFEVLHGERLIPVLAIRTASGGLHLYFLLPEEIEVRNSTSKIAEGFDVRGLGGYCVFAGSVRHDGKKYEFITDFEEAYNA